MKNYFLLFFFLSISWNSLSAQETPVGEEYCGVNFVYDNAGNRIVRLICLNNVELEYRTTAEEEELGKSIDLEKMMASSDFSEELEMEIEQLETLLSDPQALNLQEKDAKTKEAFPLTDQNFSNLSDLLVFPNPAMTSFSIRAEGLHPEATLSILSMDGRILSQRSLGDGRDIDVSSLPEGAYVLTLVDKTQRRVSMLIKSGQDQ
ncbi:MAG: T9SS type A sorting domain-containing protein [Bacteroidota bacterium]